ncbi:MAG: SurA N-terminal domain-containing protein [Thermodesulfovibrionales bacterium]|nr:SurA N-terminal domain-containing protein [Thermodesulfovibrionales bacterium]
MKRLIIISIILLLAIAGCGEKKSSGPVVAKVNDTAITKEDVMRKLDTLPPYAQQFFQGPQGMKRLVDELVKTEVLYAEAKKKGYDRDKEYRDQVEEFKKQYQRELERLQKEYKSRVEEFQKIAAIRLLLKKELPQNVEITDKEIRDFYERNKNNLREGGKIVEFDAVKDRIRESLIENKQAEVFNKYVEELQKKYTITINDKELETLSAPKGEGHKIN